MSPGNVLGIWLISIIAQVVPWAIVDYVQWRAGKQTLSQLVILKAKKSKWYARTIFAVLVVFQCVIIWLYFHWELGGFLL